MAAVLAPYQKRTLPVVYGNYVQEFTVNSPGSLNILDYATDANGKVNFYSTVVGDRFYLYQTSNAAYPIHLVGAINIDNKTFTRGGKSYVEAVHTPDGVVVSGDLMFPPSGVLISSSCDWVQDMTDASGNQNWSGHFYSNKTYANGDGTTYSVGAYNQDGCWYPMGFVIQSNVSLNQNYLNWSGCDSSGTYLYSQDNGDIVANGSGDTFSSNTGGWSANYADVIYDNLNGCIVRYDGMGGYYVEDNSGGGGGGDPNPSCSQGSATGNTTSQTHQTYITEYAVYVDNGTDAVNEYYNSDCSTYWQTDGTSYQSYGTVIWTREYYNSDEWGNPDGPYYEYFYSDGNGSYYQS